LSSEHVERRLAAILAADVAGSCRLIGIDEEGTLAQLKALRKTLFDPKVSDHRGRIVKNTGDGALVEFASVVDAIRCADEIQRCVAEQNTNVPQDKRIEFRIGVHVGDIIIADDDIFGDGVNIAVRLEGIAEPGGVSVSDDAHRQIRGKVEITFENMGSQSLKNIVEPMRVWRVRIDPSSSPASVTNPPTETPALPDRPSIAVLPFQNLSDVAQSLLIWSALKSSAQSANRPKAFRRTTIIFAQPPAFGGTPVKRILRHSTSPKLPTASTLNSP
jgi:adenylate cyclase